MLAFFLNRIFERRRPTFPAAFVAANIGLPPAMPARAEFQPSTVALLLALLAYIVRAQVTNL